MGATCTNRTTKVNMLRNLEQYERERDIMLNRIISIDETWARTYETEPKRQSAKWCHQGPPQKHEVRQNPSLVKLMNNLHHAIRNKRPELLDNAIILHDNATAHTAALVQTHLWRWRWEVLEHPPYSPGEHKSLKIAAAEDVDIAVLKCGCAEAIRQTFVAENLNTKRQKRWHTHWPNSDVSCVTKRSGNMKASAGMPRRRGKAQYQHMNEFEQGRMVGLPKQRIEEGHTRRGAGSGPHNVTTAWDDRHLVHMAVIDCTASSTVLSRHWSTATGVDLSASMVRRCLLRVGLVAHMLLHQLPFSRNHQCLRLQWAHERCHWRVEWQNVAFG
ncbi:hypothetical protein ANN_04345 [Periplaneta americana]|uniref:Tc1-like transposase DDE domain-containing protein n=1 Tax=Periplaneta americana TaxID=6978 RepID=A0ABQ8T8B0_PERAM|nr:hypothetical protein ANN_04345 [Periplaneta americana]